jgi:hypothetical protein
VEGDEEIQIIGEQQLGELRIYAHLFRQKDDKAAEAINEALAKLGYGA